ncbi:inositol polyphosphate 1-phosphatase [Epargyreus clarus]|uniref:inositol polyphosphate 1-phosphatase n=1 Tax=Epargyreus clarus TaxID=520877 RepID=UPI003C2AF87C
MANVLEALINASEKAANIARSCCSGCSDNTLLVAEKCEGEANARFDKDFKTIADVLAQESAKSEILKRLPELTDNVRGEECAEINGLRIELQESSGQTAELLNKLVPAENAIRMAEAAHNDVNAVIEELPGDLPFIDPNDLGVWIDPIDATAEFIAGVRGEAAEGKGLPCVTVLIGAYLRSTGEPVVGVVNQPFYNNGKGRIVWGVHYGETCKWYGGDENSGSNIILMSGAEKPEIIQKFKNSGWEVKSVPGAGHKLLKVALGEAAAYIVSQGTTFRWDTCAPHSVVRARGGDVLSYSKLIPITYNDSKDLDTQEYCNSEGIIAYTNQDVFDKIKNILYES